VKRKSFNLEGAAGQRTATQKSLESINLLLEKKFKNVNVSDEFFVLHH